MYFKKFSKKDIYESSKKDLIAYSYLYNCVFFILLLSSCREVYLLYFCNQ